MREFKDVFAWTYKNLKRIPLELTQHRIEMDTTIPSAHQARYRLNPNYARIVKQDIKKLLAIGFIESIEKATWLSPIIIVPKKNGELRICINLRKLNATTKKDPYSLPFTYEVMNTVIGHEAYSFVNGYSRYHQTSIAPKDKYKTTFVTDWGVFIWKGMSFGV